MQEIIEYNKAKLALEQFRQWESLIGKEYFGGTRGKGGEYGKISSVKFTCEIYHQASDGAKNYHESVELTGSAVNAIDKAAMIHAPIILQEAERILRENLAAAARAAQSAAQSIIEDAKSATP